MTFQPWFLFWIFRDMLYEELIMFHRLLWSSNCVAIKLVVVGTGFCYRGEHAADMTSETLPTECEKLQRVT